MTTRRGLFGLFAGAMAAPAVAKTVPAPVLPPAGDAYSFTPTVSNYSPREVVWSFAHPAPPGVSIDPDTGVMKLERRSQPTSFSLNWDTGEASGG